MFSDELWKYLILKVLNIKKASNLFTLWFNEQTLSHWNFGLREHISYTKYSSISCFFCLNFFTFFEWPSYGLCATNSLNEFKRNLKSSIAIPHLRMSIEVLHVFAETWSTSKHFFPSHFSTSYYRQDEASSGVLSAKLRVLETFRSFSLIPNSIPALFVEKY